MNIRLGFALPVQKTFAIGRDIPEVARATEQIGYDSLWAGERVLFPEPPADGDRRRPIRLSIATTVTITPGRADEQDRRPFAGSLEQVTSDAIRFTQAVPATDLLMSLSGSMTSAGQLIDTAGTLHAALRAAGV